MVACLQENERIVISTMALDWAGHYELLENILYYLVVGIPSVAFINKGGRLSKEFEFIISESKLSKTAYISYRSLAEATNNGNKLNAFHTLYVFSPDYNEDEVSSFWDSFIKPQDRYIKLIYYKYINDELVLVNFSYSSYIDAQKRRLKFGSNHNLKRDYGGIVFGKLMMRFSLLTIWGGICKKLFKKYVPPN